MPSPRIHGDDAPMNTHRNPKPGLRALRKGPVSMPGQVYLVTTTCRDRRPHFESWEAASTVSATLTEHRLWRGSRLLGWVLMPDHLHLLVQLADTESLPKLMQRVKAVTARAINLVAGRRRSTLWAPGYHDRAVRAEEDCSPWRATSSPTRCAPGWLSALVIIPTGMQSGSPETPTHSSRSDGSRDLRPISAFRHCLAPAGRGIATAVAPTTASMLRNRMRGVILSKSPG